MKRSEDRILTTHVGSLARPKELVANPVLGDAMKFRNPTLEAERLNADALRHAVSDVVKKQAQVGLDIINDGEFGKSSWAGYILERISGFELRPDQLREVEWLGRDTERFADFIGQAYPIADKGIPAEVCVGPITYHDHSGIRRDLVNLKDALKTVTAVEAFYTAVAPASTAFNGVNEYYPNDHDYVFAIAEALREEYLDVYNAGLLVQVDDAVLANMFDALMQKSRKRYREWAELRIEALNHALRGIPEDRVRYHVCFGSWHLPHTSDAPLAEIIDLILRVKAGAYSIEAANVRHEHEWRVWEEVKLPPGKILIPGVITHHTISVEHPQLVADRIIQFAQLVGRENVIAGTDCGFAQVDIIQRVHPSVMWAKLESLVEGARLATKSLWGR